ncbi:serine/threonine-protein phosphatase 4 regulatory subunit 2-like [Eucyclogobius newberryi]|uniref:serine/threonine-protein phosphatase 4 regulatory subunit 2-like n=1 Tax=Eucyclogobius newberryi TaxID=166745 RepID=UPI003B5A0855
MDITSLLEALQDFEKMGKKETIPLLEQFLCHVAKTGEPLLSWTEFKPYFVFKLESIMDSFHAAAPEQRLVDNPNVEHVTFEEMKNRILKIVDSYNGIPFTIQRLCELLTDPKRNYSGTGKFLRGLEKNVMVVSCLCTNAEKNGSTNANRMNGVMFQGNSQYSESQNINGPSTPKPLNRSRLVLASAFSTNGLPESKESESTTDKPEDPISDTLLSEEVEVSPNVRTKNKHQEEEEDEEGVEQSDEGPEVKRLKCETEEKGPERASEEELHPSTEEDAGGEFCETPAISENEDGMSENQNATSEDKTVNPAVDEQEAETPSMTDTDSEPDAVKSSDKEEPAPATDSTDCDADSSDGLQTENKPVERD